MSWCECDAYFDVPEPNRPTGREPPVVCPHCGLQVECEYAFLDDGPGHPAQVRHVDLLVCVDHEPMAWDAVHSRTCPGGEE